MPVLLFQKLPQTYCQSLKLQSVVFPEAYILFPSSLVFLLLPNNVLLLWRYKVKDLSKYIIMLWTVSDGRQTSTLESPAVRLLYLEISSECAIQDIFWRYARFFFISLVLNYFICITCLMGELNFLSLYYQCFTCMPLATCSWLRWLSPLHLSVHQYLCSAQPVDHFPLLNIAWYKQKTLWLKQARKQASKQPTNQPKLYMA